MKSLQPILFILVVISMKSFSQNVLLEDFIFDPVDSLENSGEWYRSGINSIYNIKVVAPGLEYSGYVGSGLGNTSLISNAGEGDIVYRNFSSPILSGSAYMSFMLRIDSLPATFTQGYCIAFNPASGGTDLNTKLVIVRTSDTTFLLGVDKRIFDLSTSNYDIHKTYLVVLKYSIADGLSNDTASIYVFSTDVPSEEPSQPNAFTDFGGDYTGPGSVYLNNNYAQSGLHGCKIHIDGIRVGTTWANSVLEPGTPVSTSQSISGFTNEIYPNPFNVGTTIKFEIPAKGFVRINVYNSSGMNCAELVNEILDGGSYKINWNAAGLAPGLYTCKMQFNGHWISNKLVLVK